MAFAGNIDEKLKKNIKDKLCIDENDFNEILKIFEYILSLIESNYLAHLKSVIEDTINKKIKTELIDQIKISTISPNAKNSLEKMINIKQFRPFTILLTPLDPLNPLPQLIPLGDVISRKKTCLRRSNRSAIILYDPNVEIKQLRIFLAHEFGHIIIREFCSDRLKTNEENNANLFAFFAILDKDNFYKSEAKKLTHHDAFQLLNEVVFLKEKKEV